MLPQDERLTTAQFDRAFAHSQTVRHPLVSVRAHFRGDGESQVRAAFVVPKKQAKKATQRNLIRRRLRERYRLHPSRNLQSLLGCDLIFMATPQTQGASVQELDAALEEVLRRAGKKNQSLKGTTGVGQRSAAVPAVESSSPSENPALENPEREAATRMQEEGEEVAPASQPLPVYIALGIIRFYQRFISPGLPPSCRFEPTCSRYTYASIERFGLLRGSFLGAARICRCHPWHAGGYDPVPQLFPVHRSKSQNK
jgi:putative membrane protein insertion efficiency factor/ribonuclease P protein component